MSGYCDRCGNTMCVCSGYEPQTADLGARLKDRCDGCDKDMTYVSMWPWRSCWFCARCYELALLRGKP